MSNKLNSFNNIARAWNEYGRGYAKYKSLWDNSIVLATLGPQVGGGTTARDYSGRNNHGTLVGATHLPTWSTSGYKGLAFPCITFDGSDDYVSVVPYGSSEHPELQISGTQTHSCWANITNPASASTQMVFVRRDGDTLATIAWSLFNSSGLYYSQMCNGSSAPYITASSSTGWHHLVHKYIPSVAHELWIDGVLAASNYVSVLSSILGTNHEVIIGARGNNTSNKPYHLAGNVAEVRSYSRPLTIAEIAILARTPLTAYETVRPKWWFFPTISSTTNNLIFSSRLHPKFQSSIKNKRKKFNANIYC